MRRDHLTFNGTLLTIERRFASRDRSPTETSHYAVTSPVQEISLEVHPIVSKWKPITNVMVPLDDRAHATQDVSKKGTENIVPCKFLWWKTRQFIASS